MAMTTPITTMRSSLPLSLSNSYQHLTFIRGWESSGFFSMGKDLPGDPCSCIRAGIMAFASRKSEKKGRNNGKTSKSIIPLGKNNPLKHSEDSSGDVPAGGGGFDTDSFSANTSETSPITSASRGAVLQSCISTSVFLLAFGALVRQASHVASMEGWTTFDASAEVSWIWSRKVPKNISVAGVSLGLQANMPTSFSKSRMYFRRDKNIPRLDLSTSIPKKYLKGPRYFISNSRERYSARPIFRQHHFLSQSYRRHI